MTTTYQLICPNPTESMFRGVLVGIQPRREQDRRMCELVARLHQVSKALDGLRPLDVLTEGMVWGFKQMVEATTANVINTRLLKNDRDVFRTLNEMEKRTSRYERILGIHEYKEICA